MTTSIISEISRTGGPWSRLSTPSARIRPATASQAAPMVSARTVCGPSLASRIVTPACYGDPQIRKAAWSMPSRTLA